MSTARMGSSRIWTPASTRPTTCARGSARAGALVPDRRSGRGLVARQDDGDLLRKLFWEGTQPSSKEVAGRLGSNPLDLRPLDQTSRARPNGSAQHCKRPVKHAPGRSSTPTSGYYSHCDSSDDGSVGRRRNDAVQRIVATAFAAALAVPIAFGAPAKKPPTGPGCKPAVSVILKGTLTNDPEFVGAGTFTMNTTGANKPGKVFVGGAATITVWADTKVRRQNTPKLIASLEIGDRAVVQLRACKGALPLDAGRLRRWRHGGSTPRRPPPRNAGRQDIARKDLS